MHSVFLILGLLACPLGMFAMGGVAWAAGKLGVGRSSADHRDDSHAQAAPRPAPSRDGQLVSERLDGAPRRSDRGRVAARAATAPAAPARPGPEPRHSASAMALAGLAPANAA